VSKRELFLSDRISKFEIYVRELFSISSLVSERFRHFPWFFDFIFRLSSIYRREQTDRNFMFGVLMDIVARKSIKREAEVASFADNTFLSRLLRLKGKLSEKQLKDHIFTVTEADWQRFSSLHFTSRP
jgi:hypothetical protein